MKTDSVVFPAVSAFTDAEIRERAYYLWLEHGCPANRDQEMWFAAQTLLHDRNRISPAEARHDQARREFAPELHLHETRLLQDARPDVARSGAPQRQRSREAKNRSDRS
jgi:hypothetical protein